MLRTLKAMARKRGDDPRKVKLEHWRNHDLRRVVRSGLSKLKVVDEVAEAVLAHSRKGIQGVYDKHDYFDEKKEALTLWAGRLSRDIITPPPANVVKLNKSEGIVDAGGLFKKRLMANAEGDDQPSPPVYFKTLTQAQCDYFAKWVVERLSNWMAGEEILNVLKRARMQAASVRDVPPSEALIAGGRAKGKTRKVARRTRHSNGARS